MTESEWKWWSSLFWTSLYCSCPRRFVDCVHFMLHGNPNLVPDITSSCIVFHCCSVVAYPERKQTDYLWLWLRWKRLFSFFFWREYSRRSDRMTVSDSLLPWRLYGVKKQRASEHRMVSVWMTEGEQGGELRVPAAHREFLHVCPRVALAHVCLCVWCCHRRAPAFPLLTC